MGVFSTITAELSMKADIHPKYNDVVFQDVTSDFIILTRSTLTSKEKIKWEDGNEYPLIKVEVSSASHPFYTGKQKLMDTSGRVDKFRKRYGAAKPEAAKEEAAKYAAGSLHGTPECVTGQRPPCGRCRLRATRRTWMRRCTNRLCDTCRLAGAARRASGKQAIAYEGARRARQPERDPQRRRQKRRTARPHRDAGPAVHRHRQAVQGNRQVHL
jgi:large subunit ribosomal protein L31